MILQIVAMSLASFAFGVALTAFLYPRIVSNPDHFNLSDMMKAYNKGFHDGEAIKSKPFFETGIGEIDD